MTLGNADPFAVLRPAERECLLTLRRRNPHVGDAIEQLERILSSRTFSRVQQRAKDFLGFVVGRRLLGRHDQVKQATIAMAVFGETADFNPLETSRVRVAGSALRDRLAEYYRREGRLDPIVIVIPPGTYVPHLGDERVTILVDELANWNPEGDRSLGVTFASEIARALKSGSRFKIYQSGEQSAPSAARFRLRGSVEIRERAFRMNISLSDAVTTRVIYWHTFEVQTQDAFKLPRRVARVIASAILKTERREYSA